VIDGTESIDEVGQRVFAEICRVAGGVQAKAEQHKHREFQFWAEQTVSL
jgi:arabinonate dehydratase